MKEPLSIQSRNNPKVKAIAGLKESKLRRQSGKFLVEGIHEIGVAMEYGFSVDSVFLTATRASENCLNLIDDSVPIYQVPDSVFQKLSQRQHPEGILCVCHQKPLPAIEVMPTEEPTVLILDGVEKPGNFGAILRSAAAFGIRKVVISGGSLDPYNPQVIRNSRAHSLSFDHFKDEADKIQDWLKRNGYTSFVASPESADAIQEIDFTDTKTAIVLGSEHDGVSGFWKEEADRSFSIPMTGKVDSLNVAVSASIVLYEAFKQRRKEVG